MGLWRASAGSIRFGGADITRLPTPDIARLGIAYVPESVGVFTTLTVRENMVLAARSGRFESARLDGVFALFPVLEEKWHQEAGNLSSAQKQMLAIGRAIVEPRRLLVVDEPTKGLAPAVIEHLIGGFRTLKETRTTILLSSRTSIWQAQLATTRP
jgi:branched-chain amino acid transport system ATP-binding protein